ncbi:AAA family ATPase, putative [Plasmodium ovale]|uniref:AAA family ATPase, putative n=1 Tax=Plasmodium ovale TaxID=36330 RepID=A0A1C3KXI0_PLAOA|nr:AAA family ATPase, putative [Plasmodium ovale]
MHINFYIFEDEEEKGDIASNFNVYCTNDLLKSLELNKNENAVILYKDNRKEKEEKTFCVCCCFRSCTEIKVRKKIEFNGIYANRFVIQSLNLDVESEEKSEQKRNGRDGAKVEKPLSRRVEIRKGALYAPIKEIKLNIRKIYNETHDNLREYFHVDNLYNDMVETFWKNVKSKNMEKYINLSLLNTCLFPHNFLKIGILGVQTHLLVTNVILKGKKKKSLIGVDNSDNTLQIPYIDQSTKIVIHEKEDEKCERVDTRSCKSVGKDDQNPHEVAQQRAKTGEKENTKVANEQRGDRNIPLEGTTQWEEFERTKEARQTKKNKYDNYLKKRVADKWGLNKIGGYGKIKEEIYYYILLPLIYKNIYDEFHIDINRGILLHGPPGCGKTFIALAIKEELSLLRRKLIDAKLTDTLDCMRVWARHEKGKKQSGKEVSRKEVSGKEVSGKEVSGKEVSGKEVSGKEVSGKGVSGKGVSGKGVGGKGVGGKQESDKGASYEVEGQNPSCGIDLILPEMEMLKSTDLIDSNNSGTKINELFLRCYKRYKEEKKCSILFIDEIEILCEKRENESVNLYTTTLLNNMDGIKKHTHIILIGATNYINKIDLALRRSGRFDKDIEINVPNLKDRISILKKKLLKINHTISNKKIKEIADMCQSFTCSDINALINISMYLNLKENNVISRNKLKKSIRVTERVCKKENSPNENYERVEDNALDEAVAHENCPVVSTHTRINNTPVYFLKYKHLLKGLKYVKPSGMKELYVDIPKTRISDIGGYKFVKTCIKECLIYPKKYKQVYEKYNIQSPKGILLYGPPGCSKTLFAKAIASEIRMNFISVKGPEIFSKYVGESEKTIRNIFKKARENNPCVIFFDEIDSIAVNRNVNQNFVSNRVLCQLLNEIDGIYNRVEVIVLAATNRPDLIDPALLRPGRFDRIIYVPLPNYTSRFSIFKKTLSFYRISNMINEEGETNDMRGMDNVVVHSPLYSNLCKESDDGKIPIYKTQGRAKGGNQGEEVKTDRECDNGKAKEKKEDTPYKENFCLPDAPESEKESGKKTVHNEKHYFEDNVDFYEHSYVNLGEKELGDNREIKIVDRVTSSRSNFAISSSPILGQSKKSKIVNKAYGNQTGMHGKGCDKRKDLNVRRRGDNTYFLELCRFLARNTKKYSGAEIVNICREASICALRETLKKCKNEVKGGKDFFPTSSFTGLSKAHFVKVLNKIKPQTSHKLISFYKNYNKQKKS